MKTSELKILSSWNGQKLHVRVGFSCIGTAQIMPVVMSFVLVFTTCSQVRTREGKGPIHLVFCRLYPAFPRPLRQSLAPTLPVDSLLLTNTVSPVRACLLIWLEGWEPKRRRAWASQYLIPEVSWARICKPFKELRNRFPAWRAATTTLFVILTRQVT